MLTLLFRAVQIRIPGTKCLVLPAAPSFVFATKEAKGVYSRFQGDSSAIGFSVNMALQISRWYGVWNKTCSTIIGYLGTNTYLLWGKKCLRNALFRSHKPKTVTADGFVSWGRWESTWYILPFKPKTYLKKTSMNTISYWIFPCSFEMSKYSFLVQNAWHCLRRVTLSHNKVTKMCL